MLRPLAEFTCTSIQVVPLRQTSERMVRSLGNYTAHREHEPLRRLALVPDEVDARRATVTSAHIGRAVMDDCDDQTAALPDLLRAAGFERPGRGKKERGLRQACLGAPLALVQGWSSLNDSGLGRVSLSA